VTIEQAGGDMVLPTPWTASDLDYVRWIGEGDVIFVGCNGRPAPRIERQDRVSTPASRSWSVVEYAPTDGPFGKLNTGPVQLKGSALSGEITLTASRNFFKTTHVGGLFRLTSAGQQVSQRITARTPSRPDQGDGRRHGGPLVPGRSHGPDLHRHHHGHPAALDCGSRNMVRCRDLYRHHSVSIYDNLDNQIAYYRIGVKTGAFTGGDDLTAALTFSAGSINGVARVTGYTSQTAVSASVLTALGAADAFTQDWYEGDWSPKNGYPSAVDDFDTRLVWSGKGFRWLTAVDLLDSLDNLAEGDDARSGEPWVRARSTRSIGCWPSTSCCSAPRGKSWSTSRRRSTSR
jgi:hypothetical protein